MPKPQDTETAASGTVRRRRRWPLALAFGAGAASFGLVIGVVSETVTATNSLEFCAACHTMDTSFKEYQQSAHYRNSAGVRAICTDCHVPKPLIPKLITKLVQTKDVWHELIGTIDTPEKFEARRWLMANRVWQTMKESDSRECRSCHDLTSMDLGAQGKTASSKHASAREQGKTCIDCHTGLVHREPEEPPKGGDPG